MTVKRGLTLTFRLEDLLSQAQPAGPFETLLLA